MKGISLVKKLFREMGDFDTEKKELEQKRDKTVRDLNNKINRKQRAIDRRADKIVEIWEIINQDKETKTTIIRIKERITPWAVAEENLNKAIAAFRRRRLKKLYRIEIITIPKKLPIKKMFLNEPRRLAGIKCLKLIRRKELVITLRTGEKILRTLSTFEKLPPSR